MWMRLPLRAAHRVLPGVGVVLVLLAVLAATAGPARAQAAASLASSRMLTRPASVGVAWRDDSALATWPPVPGADGYLVSLLRLRDGAVMVRQRVPAAERSADLPGLWPGERYAVAVQTLDSANRAGPPAVSRPGAPVPLFANTSTGFLDNALAAPGPLDADLWDQRTLTADQPAYGAAYIASPGETDLIAGCPAGSPCYGQPAVTVLRARAPFDWTGRTLTVRGEVDLKGDAHQSFGAILAPEVIAPGRVLDLGQRFFQPVALPMIELYSSRGETSLLYAAGYGGFPMVLAHTRNPTGVSGLRDDIVWRVSATHTSVQLDGATVFDLDWPASLPYATGYLSLFAEDDPRAGSSAQPTCDDAPNPCAVWHLGPWGFDAPWGDAQHATAAYAAGGCDLAGSATADGSPAVLCGAADLLAGETTAYAVPVADASGLAAAAVVFDARDLTMQGNLTLSINGGPPVGIPDVVPDGGASGSGAFGTYRVPIPPSLLMSGANRVIFRLQGETVSAVTLANVQIETVASAAAVPSALPPEPAPLSYWTAGSP